MCNEALLERILYRRLRHRRVAELASLEVLEGVHLLERASESANALQLTLRGLVESVANALSAEHGLHGHHGWVLIEIRLLLESLIKSCSEAGLLPWASHAWTTTERSRLWREASSCWEAVGHAEPPLSIFQDLSEILLLLLQE